MSWLFREPERDLELAKALRRLEADSTPHRDAGTLRRRIVAAARPRLAQRRAPAPRWWELISTWNRVALPIGVAASLAAGLLVQLSGDASALGNYGTDMGSDSTLVLAAFSESVAGGQLMARLIAPESGDWLLQQAVEQ